jgi:hypothetical protein
MEILERREPTTPTVDVTCGQCASLLRIDDGDVSSHYDQRDYTSWCEFVCPVCKTRNSLTRCEVLALRGGN